MSIKIFNVLSIKLDTLLQILNNTYVFSFSLSRHHFRSILSDTGTETNTNIIYLLI